MWLARRNWDVFMRVEGFIVLFHLASVWALWQLMLPTILVVALFLVSLLEKRPRVLRTSEITCWIFLAATLIYPFTFFRSAGLMDAELLKDVTIMTLTYALVPGIFVQGMRATRRFRRLALKEEEERCRAQE